MLKATLGDLAFWSAVKEMQAEKAKLPRVPWTLTEYDREFLRAHLIAPV